MTNNAIIGTTKEFLAACHREPESLTDRDFAVLESTDPDIAAERRQECARALAKKAEAERVAAQQREAVTRAPIAAHSLVRLMRKEFQDRHEDESLDGWSERNKWYPVPVFMFQEVVMKTVLPFLHETNERNKERNVKIETLERRCAELESQLALGDARVKALEGRPAGISYEGVWDAAKVYARGTFITHGGSVWHAEQRSVSCRPGSDPRVWKLAVKKGTDGRDLRSSGQDAT
jgi:hypothetical protein